MLEGAPQGSWKLLAALCVCFLEGDLFVGVFIGTCEEISLENNVCGLCGAVCGIAKERCLWTQGRCLL